MNPFIYLFNWYFMELFLHTSYYIGSGDPMLSGNYSYCKDTFSKY